MALETAFIQEKLAQQFGNNVLNFEMKKIFSLLRQLQLPFMK